MDAKGTRLGLVISGLDRPGFDRPLFRRLPHHAAAFFGGGQRGSETYELVLHRSGAFRRALLLPAGPRR